MHAKMFFNFSRMFSYLPDTMPNEQSTGMICGFYVHSNAIAVDLVI